MSLTPSETEKGMDLLQSRQIPNILLGLEIAERLHLNIQSFLDDIEILYTWITTGREAKEVNLAEKIHRLHSTQSPDIATYTTDKIPSQIRYLSHLTELNVSANQLTHLPEEIGTLVHLTDLWLHTNMLEELPPAIGNLTQLLLLCLENNCLTSVPAEIGNLTQLDSLNLDENELNKLPKEISNLKNLAMLTLFKNVFEQLLP